MPSITITKKDLLKLVNKKVSDDQLLNTLTSIGIEVQELKDETNIEVNPNRPDLLSEEGLARAILQYLNIKPGLKQYKANKSGYVLKIDKKTEKVRPVALAAVIKNINLDDPTVISIMQLQEKLHLTHGRNRKKVAIGIHDLDKVSFPVLYTTKLKNFKFIPLDFERELTLTQILNQLPKGREYAHILENFDEYPLFIDNKGQVLSMPPIINADYTRITPKTKNLFIDITGTDQLAVEQALNILVTALADRNSTIYQVKVENKFYPNLEPQKIKINLNYINKWLGLNLKEQEVKKLVAKMGFSYDKQTVLIPCYRTDILHQTDIAEDIAIAYGYENFKPELPNIATIAEESKQDILHRKIAYTLTGLNFLECNTYHITNEINLNKKMNTNTNFVSLKNALTSDYNILRSWLLPSLIEVLSKNKHYEYPQKIFEIGKVFTKDLKEPSKLALVICNTKTDYTEIKQVLDCLLSLLNLQYEISETEHSSFIKGRIGKIIVNKKEIGFIGELNPIVIENYQLKNPITAFEINLDSL